MSTVSQRSEKPDERHRGEDAVAVLAMDTSAWMRLNPALKWLVRPGDRVRAGDPFATLLWHRPPPQDVSGGAEESKEAPRTPSEDAAVRRQDLLAPVTGRITGHLLHGGWLSRDIGDEHELVDVATLHFCSHPMVFSGMCVSCTVRVSTLPRSFPPKHNLWLVSTVSPEQESRPPASWYRWPVMPGGPIDVTFHSAPVGVARSQAPESGAGGGAHDTHGRLAFHARGGFRLQLAQHAAEQVDLRVQQRLLQHRKLSLILDLDHTLLHATHQLPDVARADALGYPLHRFEEGGMKYFIKLRPCVHDFLRRASSMFELSVDTAATRRYGEHVMRLLDPDGTFFGRRLVSRCDSAMRHKQVAWLHGHLTDDAMVLIVDDTELVWRGAPNLIVIEPYRFFRDAPDVNNAPGQSLTGHARSEGELTFEEEEDSGEPPRKRARNDDSARKDATKAPVRAPQPGDPVEESFPYLEGVLSVLEWVHAAFYGLPMPGPEGSFPPLRSTRSETCESHGRLDATTEDAPPRDKEAATTKRSAGESDGRGSEGAREGEEGAPELPLLRRPHDTKVLLQHRLRWVMAGTTLVFSGVFPRQVNPAHCPLYRRARVLGAEIADRVDPDLGVTHVVARQAGTAKVMDAARTSSICIVHLNWLVESLRRYRRLPEEDYPLPRFEKFATRKPASIPPLTTPPPPPPPDEAGETNAAADPGEREQNDPAAREALEQLEADLAGSSSGDDSPGSSQGDWRLAELQGDMQDESDSQNEGQNTPDDPSSSNESNQDDDDIDGD